jgi:FlaA1/EpsC-like NDP-sugar epimerase
MIESLRSSGVFDILIFIFFFIFFYAILMKSKIFGSSVGVNGVIALVIAFLISIYSSFTGFGLIEPLSRFFTQAIVIFLLFIIALVIASIFYPDFPKMLTESFKSPTILYILIPLALALLITSRSIWVFWAGSKPGAGPSGEITVLIIGLLIFVVVLIIAAFIGGKK